MTQKRVVAVVFLLWVLSAFLSIPMSKWIPEKVLYSKYATINAFCIITSGLLYCKIYAAVRRHTNQIHAQRVAGNRDMANAARLRKTAVSTFYVYVVFLACYVPVFWLSFATLIGGLTAVPFDLWYYVFTLMYLNSSLNPLIYSWKIRGIRQAGSGHTSKHIFLFLTERRVPQRIKRALPFFMRKTIQQSCESPGGCTFLYKKLIGMCC